MIAQLRGHLIERRPPRIVIDVQGVGYELDVPMSTFYQLPETGEPITILTHFVVREDAQLLYGFATDAERELFRTLLKVTGIGARIALAVLSGMSVAEFTQAVHAKEITRLVRIPGIGKKTAERLVVELRDRLAQSPIGLDLDTVAVADSGSVGVLSSARDDALGALEALGYKSSEAEKMIKTHFQSGMSVEDIIRAALKASIR